MKKKGNTLVIIFFVLLVIFGSLVFLIKKQRNIFQNNQRVNQSTNQTNINQSAIPTVEPVSQGLTLEVIEPKEKATYNDPSIKVSGKTSAYAEVYVNDIQTKADEKGYFSLNYNLDEGENLLTITANDKNGNYAEKEITVFLQTQE
jgi:competence protein ComGC